MEMKTAPSDEIHVMGVDILKQNIFMMWWGVKREWQWTLSTAMKNK